MHKSLRAGITAITIALGGSSAWAAEQIGIATAAVNKVEGAIDGTPRKINVEDNVFFDEHVTTGPEGATEFVFKDETILQLGPDSALTLDAFVYEPTSQNAAQKMAITLSQGTFRFVSGHMDKKAYEINLPFGHIGVRGTSFTVDIDLENVAHIFVEFGQVVITGNDGKSTVFPAGTQFKVGGLVDGKTMIVPTAGLLIRNNVVRLNTIMAALDRIIPYALSDLASKITISHDAYEEGCH